MHTPGSPFLHERNPNFHATPEVEIVANYLRNNGEAIPADPAGKISAYLGFLANEECANDGILTGDQSSIDRQIDAHVIKTEEVPDGYFELQRRIAREQGRGDVQITPETRREDQRVISADQQHSLKTWAEYLSLNDARYPDWFRVYAFDNVLKMGKFDKQKEEFQQRSNLTTVPFPELSRGALTQVYSWLQQSKIDGKAVGGVFEDDEREVMFQKALKSGNFSKLYMLAIHKTQEGLITPEQLLEIRGSWKRYVQNSDPSKLHGDLQGYGLDWCTATGRETANKHIKGGDFFVYYTRDKDGKDTVPRVAIRMKQGAIAEVRGVSVAQELEDKMADIAAERLKDLPGGEKYIRKAHDMKCLTAIEKKTVTDPDVSLTNEELRLLYELDHEIQGFGYGRDPRISEIRARRRDADEPELARIMPESIGEQVKGAFVAYKAVAEQLAGMQSVLRRVETTLSPNELERLFTAKDKEWQENGTYDYLAEQLIENGTRFSLVATPNIEASEAQIVAVAENFGKDQPYPTCVYDELYRKGRYDSRQWSGSTGNAPVRLSLIPSSTDSQTSYKRTDVQLRMLRELQASRPKLQARVPSLLDTVTYWYSLRAQGDKLDDYSAYAKTFIRYFDLEPKKVGRNKVVPCSWVDNAGSPYLKESIVDDGNGARLAVG